MEHSSAQRDIALHSTSNVTETGIAGTAQMKFIALHVILMENIARKKSLSVTITFA
jgi:hypothetical protein